MLPRERLGAEELLRLLEAEQLRNHRASRSHAKRRAALRAAVAPTVSSIAITSDPGDDDTYVTGDEIEVTVTFSENVTVPDVQRGDMPGVRRPQLELNIGGDAKAATFKS